MRSTAFRLIAGILSLSAVSTIASAQDRINVVTTAVPFLRISPDARAGGMGDMGTATAPDASSSFYNISKTVFNQSKSGIAVTYTPWLKDLGLNDVYMATLSGYYKFTEDQAISGGLRYFSLGNIQFTDAAGNNLNTFRPREFALDFGYSRKLSEQFGIGLGLKYIYSNLAGNVPTTGQSFKAGTAVAGDVSLFYNKLDQAGQGLNAGLSISNLGTKIAYTSNADQKDFIPTNLSLGAMYTKVMDESNKIAFGLELNKLMVPTPPVDANGNITDSTALVAYRSKSVIGSWFSSFGDAPGGFKEELKEFQASLGAEYTYNNQFSVRAGYFYEDKTKGNRKYFTMGVGLKYNIFGLNFSYLLPSGSGTNRNPLSNTLRFSLIFDLGATASDDNSTSDQ
ncbi:MAG: type IX secretion system outer membrane channel protein PorV [Chitinophagaceae bacterium]